MSVGSRTTCTLLIATLCAATAPDRTMAAAPNAPIIQHGRTAVPAEQRTIGNQVATSKPLELKLNTPNAPVIQFEMLSKQADYFNKRLQEANTREKKDAVALAIASDLHRSKSAASRDNALQVFQQLSTSPDRKTRLEASNNYGVALLAQGRTQEAVSALRSIETEIQNASSAEQIVYYRNLGSTLRLDNDYSEALRAFERSIAIGPSTERIGMNVFQTATRTQQPGNSIRICARIANNLLDQGRLQDAEAMIRSTLTYPDWQNRSELEAIVTPLLRLLTFQGVFNDGLLQRDIGSINWGRRSSAATTSEPMPPTILGVSTVVSWSGIFNRVRHQEIQRFLDFLTNLYAQPYSANLEQLHATRSSAPRLARTNGQPLSQLLVAMAKDAQQVNNLSRQYALLTQALAFSPTAQEVALRLSSFLIEHNQFDSDGYLLLQIDRHMNSMLAEDPRERLEFNTALGYTLLRSPLGPNTSAARLATKAYKSAIDIATTHAYQQALPGLYLGYARLLDKLQQRQEAARTFDKAATLYNQQQQYRAEAMVRRMADQARGNL